MVFTDIEGSTRLLDELGQEPYREALGRHREVVRAAFQAFQGYEVDYEGDAFFYAFASAQAALSAVEQAMVGLDGGPIRIRVGVHTGEPALDPPKYVGMDVHHAARIMSAAHGGQVLLSEATRALSAGRSVRDLGAHRLKDLSDAQHLYQLLVEGLATDFPPPKTLDNRPTNLPSQPTPLLGRERELGEIRDLMLHGDVRLLTLTGPGGTGKTRLALQVGADLIERFPDGVWFVNLASLTDPALVVPTIAQTLAVQEEPGRTPVETLGTYLHDKHALLVVDNFEQVTDAAVDLAAVIAAAPALKVLVTSRAPLHVAAEREFAVPALTDVEAVAFFASRAQAVKASFVLNGNRKQVAEICRRLDHLPLAIELAAARITLLPEKALLERLDEKLKLLTGGARDHDERQRTLRAAIEWSHNLLSPSEQRLFGRLAVFAGGQTFEAIEAVCKSDGALDVFEGVSSLVDKNLLRQEVSADGDARFVMLETIHDYARERLAESGEADDVRRRHAETFLELATAAHANPASRWQTLPPLDAEQANFRAALDWARTHDASLGARLAVSLGPYWDYRGRATEALEWLAAFAAPDLEPGLRARLLRALGLASLSAGRIPEAAEALEEAISLLEEEDVQDELGPFLVDYGIVLVELGRHDHAVGVFRRALSIYASGTGSARLVSVAEANLAYAALVSGDLLAAREAVTAAIESCERLGDREGACINQGNLAIALLLAGELPEARSVFCESLDTAAAIQSARQVTYALAGLASVAARSDDMARAARLVGAVDARLEETGLALEVLERRLFDEVHAALEMKEFDVERAEGRAWSEQQAVTYALTAGV